MKLRNAFCAHLLITYSSFAFADVGFQKLGVYDSKGREYASLKLTGHINATDIELFKKYLKRVRKENLRLENDSVELNSQGGTAHAAIAIGKAIRKERLSTYIAPDGVCSSACTFVLIGGVCRMALGEVNVHRPLEKGFESNGKPLSADAIHQQAKLSKHYLFSYFELMEIPPQMVWDSITTPQWMSKQLSENEKTAYGLYSTDTEEQELRLNKAAIEREVTKKEMVQLLREKYKALNADIRSDNNEKHLRCSEQLFLDK
jgi:hypothetical protein